MCILLLQAMGLFQLDLELGGYFPFHADQIIRQGHPHRPHTVESLSKLHIYLMGVAEFAFHFVQKFQDRRFDFLFVQLWIFLWPVGSIAIVKAPGIPANSQLRWSV